MATNPKSSKELIRSMRNVLDIAEKTLRDPRLTSAVQIADIAFICWGLVQASFLLQRAVAEELTDLDDDTDTAA